MHYNIDEIAQSVSPLATIIGESSHEICDILTDSRSLSFPEGSLFVAITTKGGDGHNYIAELYAKGVRNFIINEQWKQHCASFPLANFLIVKDSVVALQDIAAYHRRKFDIPVIAITGSRGKTTVKEWLYQLLGDDGTVLRSPRSFNSHIGVPLSLWELDSESSLGIFEAGVSRKGEMQSLNRMIGPTIAVITNIGHEHDEGFSSAEEKAKEKVILTRGAEYVVYNKDNPILQNAIESYCCGARNKFSISRNDSNASLYVRAIEITDKATRIVYLFNGTEYSVTVPYIDEESIDNALTSLGVLSALGLDYDKIVHRMANLQRVDTRLRVLEGVNDCLLLVDGYTSDLHSLSPALDFMTRRLTDSRSCTLIMSDLVHEKSDVAALYQDVATLLKRKGVSRVIGIGEEISHYSKYFSGNVSTFPTVKNFLHSMSTSDFSKELILIKGSPAFNLSHICTFLEARQHETVLEVNLDCLMSNYNFFRSFLKKETGIVAMVKASGYGAGSYELAKTLQSRGASYLAVASHDEGVDLRKAGITMPIMVLNPKVVNYPALFTYSLEPEIYNLDVLEEIIREGAKCGVTNYPVHIKIDSGMHRLGFLKEDIPQLLDILGSQHVVVPQTIFTHLAAADDPAEDDYTLHQIEYFSECADKIQLNYPNHKILRHVLNSTGIVRFSQYQMDLVRLGIGLYGIPVLADNSMSELRPVSSLHSVIISIKEWPSGTTIGYNRRGVLQRPSRIATLPIGYADGLDRHLGNGNVDFWIHGKRCPTVGNICMDLCMIDITDCPEAKLGDRVEIFGNHISAVEIADILGTIPYEVLTSVSSRVKRVYFRE